MIGRLATLLLNNKSDTEIKYTIGYKNLRGKTVLHWAVESGKKEMTELLLAHGALVNAQDDAGRTALHLAVSAGSSPMAELLLAHGADVNLKDNQGNAPLDLADNGSSSGMAMNVVGAGSQPFSYQWQFNNGNPAPPGATKDVSTLLRQHGAISALERSTIRITRDGQVAQGVVFRQDAHAYNHHTLYEVIAYTYPHQLGLAYFSPTLHRDRDPELPGFYFPDFAHVKIRRLEANGSTNFLNVDLEAALNSGDCTKNVPLNWGDVVELPELDHKVGEYWVGLSQPIRDTLKKCLERNVQIIVNGKITTVVLEPNLSPAPILPALDQLHASAPLEVPRIDASGKTEVSSFWLSDVLRGARVLLASSDLTGVKVKRTDSATGKTEWLVFNLGKIDERTESVAAGWGCD